MSVRSIALWPLTAAIATALIGLPCWSQESTRQEFEVDLGGWQVFELRFDGTPAQPSATLDITAEPADVKTGIGALRFAYEAEKGALRAAVLGEPALAGMRSLRFWIKSSTATPVLVQLRERDESEYAIAALLPAGKWQRVAVNLADLWLDENSMDENGGLDTDQVATIALADVAPLFAMLADAAPELAGLFPVELGLRQLVIDDFELSPETVPELHPTRQTADGIELTIDSFDSGMVMWLPFGGAVAEVVQQAPGESYLRLRHEAKPFAGLMTPLVQGISLEGLQRISLRVQSSVDCVLAVSLEERDDSRYSASVVLKGSEEWQTLTVTPQRFKLDDDSEDENAQLDVGALKNLTLADVSGLIGLTGPRTLLVDDVVALVAR
ncbi:MAG: hypothetical protein PVH68_13210 [Armatimonadota bacterium]|jgi:hypothetical protein